PRYSYAELFGDPAACSPAPPILQEKARPGATGPRSAGQGIGGKEIMAATRGSNMEHDRETNSPKVSGVGGLRRDAMDAPARSKRTRVSSSFLLSSLLLFACTAAVPDESVATVTGAATNIGSATKLMAFGGLDGSCVGVFGTGTAVAVTGCTTSFVLF